MTKINVLVLEGGLNEEHEISLSSGKEVKKALKNLNINFDSLIVDPITFEQDIIKFSTDYLCFNALHGPFGEDGQIQKILDEASFRYTHSSVIASQNCFNKKLTKDIIKDTKLLTPKYLTIQSDRINEKILLNLFSELGSYIMKPNSSGSSYGVKIFRDTNDIDNFIDNIKDNLEIYKNHKELLIEKFIEGRELTVAILQKNNNTIPIEVTEVISQNAFFDYQSKYTPGFSKHILPAKIPYVIYNQCKEFAKIAHDKICCKGISRADFIYDNKQLYFLELNSQPGLTSVSLLPEQLRYRDISFDDLILNIINCAL